MNRDYEKICLSVFLGFMGMLVFTLLCTAVMCGIVLMTDTTLDKMHTDNNNNNKQTVEYNLSDDIGITL